MRPDEWLAAVESSEPKEPLAQNAEPHTESTLAPETPRTLRITPREQVAATWRTMFRHSPPPPPLPVVEQPERAPSVVETVTGEEVRKLLEYIPNNDLDYDAWWRVCAAIHSATEDSDEGKEIIHEWSATSLRKYDRGFLDSEILPYLRADRDNGITVRTLRALAVEGGMPQTDEDDFDVLPEPPKPRFPETFARTELANAERLLNRHGDTLMFVPELEAWHEYDGRKWRHVPTAQVEKLAVDLVRSLPSIAVRISDDVKRTEFLKFTASSQKKAMVQNMTMLAARECQVPAAKLDQSAHLLCVGNGVVDLRTGELKPHDSKLYMTTSTEVDYYPTAEAPLWHQTLREIFRDDLELIGFLQRLVGYAATGDPVEHVLPIPHGSGANGKGTVFGTVQHVLGGYATSCRAETFISSAGANSASGPREDILRLRGRRFVYVNEPEEGGELREGTVKSLASTDTIAARGMYAKHTVEIRPSWVAFMPTNHKPIVKGDDLGIWRRLMLIPFERSFQADPTVLKDPARGEKLLAESEGILRWIVDGALAYKAQGLKPPASVVAAAREYKDEMDVLGDWIAERCELGGFADSVGSLWQSWKAWAETRGTIRLVPSDRALGRRLKAKGFETFRTKTERGFRGLRVREDSSVAVELSPDDLV